MKLTKYNLISVPLYLGFLILSGSLYKENQDLHSQLESEDDSLANLEEQNSIAGEILKETISELDLQVSNLQREIDRLEIAQHTATGTEPLPLNASNIDNARSEEDRLEALRRARVEEMNTAEARETGVKELLDSGYRMLIDSLNLTPEKEARLSNAIAEELDYYYTVRVQLAAGEITLQEYQNYPIGDYVSEAVADVLTNDEYNAFEEYLQRSGDSYYEQFYSRQIDQLAAFVPRLTEQNRSYVAETITSELYKLREGITFALETNNNLPAAYRYALDSLYQENKLDERQMEMIRDHLEERIRRIEESIQ